MSGDGYAQMSLQPCFILLLTALLFTLALHAWVQLVSGSHVVHGQEGFTQSHQVHNSNCHFHADSGYLCPIEVVTPDGYRVRPWDRVPVGLRNQTITALEAEWRDGYSVQRISSTWLSSDTFYVMSREHGLSSEAEFIGCVGLDRKQFYPFVSNLLVAPVHRHRGHAPVLLAVCEQHAADMGFTEIRLWCEPGLVDFYTKLGWKAEKEVDGRTVFVKEPAVHSPLLSST